MKTVLLSEIDASRLQSLIRRLEQRQYRLFINSTAGGILETMGRRVIDVAVIDLILADIRGVGLIPILRRRFPEVKIIVTADPEMADHERFARTWGILAFVLKPFDVEMMEERIAYAAERRTGSIERCNSEVPR